MQVDYQTIDTLNARMTVRITREDYVAKYKTSLHDYRKKGSFKGFRKGKTPTAYLEKLFGQEVLTKTVTDLLTDAVNTYLEEHKIPYIGQPLPAPEQAPMLFDPKELAEEYSYTFDVGLLPDFEVKGLDDEIAWYDVPVSPDQIDQEWTELLKRKGTYVDSEVIDSESRVDMRFIELENLEPRPDGRENTRMIYPDMLNENIKEELMGKHVGDSIRFDPNHFLKNGDAQLFKRYYFDVKDDDESISEMIEGQVMSISTLKPAEANEELFSSAFEPGTVTSEEEARDVIGKVLKQRNDAQSDAHLRHMIEHHLMDMNPFDLPLEFIDRLVSSTEEEGKEKSDPATQADAFRWHFIKDKLVAKFEIDVTQDEILRAAADRVYNQFGGSLPYDQMKEIIGRYLGERENVEQLRNSVADTKLFFALKEHMPVVNTEISFDEFKQKQEEHQHAH